MGKAKLTLTVENQIITRAKMVANEKKISLSNVIEQFLLNEFLKTERSPQISLAEKLSGIAKSEFGNKTDKEIRSMMLKDKHGI